VILWIADRDGETGMRMIVLSFCR